MLVSDMLVVAHAVSVIGTLDLNIEFVRMQKYNGKGTCDMRINHHANKDINFGLHNDYGHAIGNLIGKDSYHMH